MAVSKEQLAEIIQGRAREMCTPEADRYVNSKASQVREMYNPETSSYDSDADKWDSMYLNEEPSRSSNNGGRDFAYSNASARNSALPDAIKESMMQQRIDVSALGQTSVLDTLGVKDVKRKKAPMTEQTIPQMQNYQPQHASIDYSIIKAIVNECLNEYSTKMQLNESSSIRTIGLSDGKINIVDNKGNIYSAKLEYKGNKNDKK